MDPEVVDRFRNARFNLVKRGYDRGEVDRFLNQWADWLESLDDEPAAADAIRAELERVGERTTGVLTAAGEAAAKLTEDAETEAEKIREEAKVAANVTRMEADRYAEETRSEADEYSERARAEARQKREDLEKVIGDLTERRDDLLDEIESIAGALTGTASEHRRRDEGQAPDREAQSEPETTVLEEAEAVSPSENGSSAETR